MAIEIDPTDASVTVTRTQTIQANSLWIDDLHVNGASRNAGPPGMEMVTTPCVRPAPTEPPTVFASESTTSRTANLWAAVANVPEIGLALVAVEAAAKALHVYNVARQADLDAANAALNAAMAAASAAQADAEGKADARVAAFKARASEADPLWTEADRAWQQATATLDAARAAATVTQATVATAQAALADPANPRAQATP